MHRFTRPSPLASLILLFALVTSVLWRSGLGAIQIEHVVSEMPRQGIVHGHDTSHSPVSSLHAHHEHELGDASLAHTMHGLLHVIDTVDTHPLLFGFHSPSPSLHDPSLDQWSHYAPEPPV